MLKTLTVIGIAAAVALPAVAEEQWQTSWYAAPQPGWDAGFALPTNIPLSLQDQTVRETLRLSAGGQRVRVVLSNRYGTEALVIGEARLARTAAGAAAGASHAITAAPAGVLTFGGQRSVTVPPGKQAVSDALDFCVRPLERLSVSTYFPQRALPSTFHWGAQQTGFIASGNQTAARQLPGAETLQGRIFLTAVHVSGGADGGTLVALGDSVTDGNGSTPDHDRRWPDYLARLAVARGLAVANAGISGARVLADRMGERAAARFEQDVLAQPGVRSVIVALGINDIGWPASAFAPHDPAMAAETLIAGYRKLIERAHANKVKVIGATMAPFENALQGTPLSDHYSPAKDAVRRQVNDWIRSSGAFDAVVDFDAVLRDPARPSRLLPAFDSGDHLHPGDAGYEAMAKAAYQVL
ncbi:SGNH/GDSL hydrolase family protein [Pseudoduganella aquatica]|uniref:SGNH/GDSL hydrolase family protein n=1 Tax=Pseudoduganella aquatica TaxID=2660641 RepID=A0A7X4HBM1_9BURK|nr:SGNH/GDSL hydrolase family protein [Pseudoduganella aquatica]MYN07280.1 SGNH/GDSL hydrolase family protein [Pseudoduganella aquatica]